MRQLNMNEVAIVSGGSGEQLETSYSDTYENQPLRVYLKTRGICGALAVGILMIPEGISFVILGTTLGLGLGLTYGYIEWAIWQ